MTETTNKNIFNTPKIESTLKGVPLTAQSNDSIPYKSQKCVLYDNYFGGNNCGLNAVMCANWLNSQFECEPSVIIGFRAHNGEEQQRCPHLIACCKHDDGKEYIYDTCVAMLSNGEKIAMYNIFVKNDYIRYYEFKVFDVVKKMDTHLEISPTLGEMKLKGIIHGDIPICYRKRPLFYNNIYKHEPNSIPSLVELKQILKIK